MQLITVFLFTAANAGGFVDAALKQAQRFGRGFVRAARHKMVL